jgi:DNA-binding IclR family transcriptional regulator
MNRCKELKLKVLSLFAATQGWLGPDEAAEKFNFFPARSAWTYLKRLWGFGLLERRSRGRGTMEYQISELGRSRLRWFCSKNFPKGARGVGFGQSFKGQ